MECIFTTPGHPDERTLRSSTKKWLKGHKIPVWLFIMRMAEAPASSAKFAFSVKLHLPRCTRITSPVSYQQTRYSRLQENKGTSEMATDQMKAHAIVRKNTSWSQI